MDKIKPILSTTVALLVSAACLYSQDQQCIGPDSNSLLLSAAASSDTQNSPLTTQTYSRTKPYPCGVGRALGSASSLLKDRSLHNFSIKV